jgi:4-oxalocrotonate tautomerase
MLTGRPLEKKERLIAEVTRCVADVLEVPIERVRVVIIEIPPEHWGIAGESVAQQRKVKEGEHE